MTHISYPRASIIVVNFNGLKWLKLFIPRLIGTQYPDFEIIVVDNASSDNSVQYIKANFEQIKMITLTENKGFAEGTNRGARQATGEVLVFLNNDIEITDDWLTQAVTKLLSDKNTAAVQCKMMQYRTRNNIDSVGISVDRYALLRSIGYDEVDEGQYDGLQEIGAASGGAMVLWKYIFNEVGCFDPLFFMYYEDIDLSWRIRSAGYKILPAISSIVYHVGSATAGAAPTSFVPFHWAKNYTVCWLKNASTKMIILYWPVILYIILAWSLFALVRKRPSASIGYIKGAVWTLTHIRYIHRERNKFASNVNKQNDFKNRLFVQEITKSSTNLSYLMKRARISTRRNRI